MKFALYTDAALTCDLPEHRLRRGDIVKLVDHHTAPDGAEGYSIEVFNAVGDAIAVELPICAGQEDQAPPRAHSPVIASALLSLRAQRSNLVGFNPM